MHFSHLAVTRFFCSVTALTAVILGDLSWARNVERETSHFKHFKNKCHHNLRHLYGNVGIIQPVCPHALKASFQLFSPCSVFLCFRSSQVLKAIK